MCTDKSLEFMIACEDPDGNHERSTPRRSETHGIAERAVRRVKEGTSSVLVQSGLQESCWAQAMECYCYFQNVQDLLADGQTPFARRFNSPLDGPIIPFGAEVKFFPISSKRGRVHQFGTKVLPGKFIAYALNAERSWTGDLSDCGYGGSANKSTIWNKCKKIQTKRSGHSQEKHRICIFLQDGRNLARRTASNYHCVQSGRRPRARISANFRRERGSPISRLSKLHKISGALWKITKIGIMLVWERNSMFRRTIFRYRWITLMSREKPKAALTLFMRQPSMVNGIFYGDRSLSEPWICVTRFELPNKNPPEGHVWVQGRRQDLDNWSRI